MAIKLVVSDLDGTLLNKLSRLDIRTIQAVNALKERGIMFTFATGRTDLNTWYYAKLLNLDLPVIACNGSLIRYPFSDKALYQAFLPEEAVDSLVREFIRKQNDFCLYTPDAIYYPAVSKTVQRFCFYNRLASTINVPQIKLINFDTWSQGRTNLCPELTVKIYCHAPNEEARQHVIQLTSQFPNLIAVKCARTAVDIMLSSSDKAAGVKRLADSLGISWSEIATFGDEANDFNMLSLAGQGFVMKNANKKFIQRLPNAIVAENHNCHGFARAIYQYIL